MVPMKDTTTANYIFSSLVGVLDKVGVDWSCAVSVVPELVHILGKRELNILYYCLMNVPVNLLILVSVNGTFK